MTDGSTDAADRPRGWRRWSRRTTVWVAGAAALVAATSAAAVVAGSRSAPASPPTASGSAPVASSADALDKILGANSELGQPVADLVKQGKLPKAAYSGDTGTVGVPKGLKAPTTPAGTIPQFRAGSLTSGFSLVQMAALALQAGCSAAQAPIAAAIGAAESSGNPGAQGDITLMDGTWDWSEGLWQIRGLKAERGTGALRDSLANADPVTNAAAMVRISSGCTNWTPWSTYNTGAYLSFLNLSKTAANAALTFRKQTGSYPPIGPGAVADVPSASPASSSAARATTARRSGSVSAAPSRSSRPSSARPSGSSARTSGTSSRPPAAASSTPKPGLSLPITLPTAIPTLVPTALPTLKLPTLPPLPLPTLSLPITLP